MALALAKAGFYGGDIEKVYNSRVDYVFETFHYEMFIRDYESAMYELNKDKK